MAKAKAARAKAAEAKARAQMQAKVEGSKSAETPAGSERKELLVEMAVEITHLDA